jgi:hypothetical protein
LTRTCYSSLDVNEHQTVSLHDPATGAQALLLFDADLVATPATVSAVVKLDSSGRNELSLLSAILPLVTGIVGAVALIAGILLARRPREEMAAELVGTSPGSAADAAPSTEHTVTEPAVTEPAVTKPAEAPTEALAEAPAEHSVVPGMDGDPPDR